MPLTTKLEADFYLQELLDNGYKVTYADVSRITGKNTQHAISRPYVMELPTWETFGALLEENEHGEAMLLTNVTYNWESYRLFAFISRYTIKKGFFARGMIPVPALMESPLKRLLANPFAYLSFSKGIRFLKNKFAARAKMRGDIRPYDVLFLAGKSGARATGMGWEADLRHAKPIHINYFDYDRYLSLGKDSRRRVSGKYAVFIDQYLPYHPDVKMFNLVPVQPESYFRELNAFFDKVEATYELEVVIAAHPKSDYHHNPYGGRTMVKDETALMIRDADLVLTHGSSAIAFCVLYNKPAFFLYNSTISSVCSRYQVQFMSDSISGYFYDTDENKELVPPGELKTDAAKYHQYKYDFLTSIESEQQLSVVLFMEAIKKL